VTKRGTCVLGGSSLGRLAVHDRANSHQVTSYSAIRFSPATKRAFHDRHSANNSGTPSIIWFCLHNLLSSLPGIQNHKANSENRRSRLDPQKLPKPAASDDFVNGFFSLLQVRGLLGREQFGLRGFGDGGEMGSPLLPVFRPRPRLANRNPLHRIDGSAYC